MRSNHSFYWFITYLRELLFRPLRWRLYFSMGLWQIITQQVLPKDNVYSICSSSGMLESSIHLEFKYECFGFIDTGSSTNIKLIVVQLRRYNKLASLGISIFDNKIFEYLIKCVPKMHLSMLVWYC